MIDARSLWTAVLEQAIIDLTNAHKRYFTQLWFTSDNHAPGSFLSICDHLDLDPSWLRRRLFADQARPVKRISMYNFHGKKLENYGGGSGLTVRLLSNYRVDREKRHRFYHRRRISLLVQLRARPFAGRVDWG